MRLHWAVISVMSDSCQRQQQGDTKWRRLSSYPWRRRQRWRRRRHLLQAAAVAFFSGSGSAPGRRDGGGARPDLPEDLDNLFCHGLLKHLDFQFWS
ncbi:Wd Repeat And Fyve Domain-Containing Protein 3 [Manis pentadactyla]|nr:Wd Repeat And Fyve Domain-Containing Protein 3 [Manis pentadactyla]